jgi:nucleoside-diphosphate-sugar epimerase
MKILITGGTGVLGRACISALIGVGHEVTAFDLPSPRKHRSLKKRERLTWHYGDIRREEDWQPLLEGQDAILHFASILPPNSEQDPEQAFAVNVEGTQRLLMAAARMNKKPLFVFPSSVSIYGKSKSTQKKTAADPVFAEDAYTSHKIQCEKQVKNAGLPWSILRVGVALEPSLAQASRGAIKTLFHISPHQPLEYIHPGDVALAISHLLKRPEAWQKVLLLGGGASCQIDHGTLLRATLEQGLGIAQLPSHLFGESAYYTHHLDTSESQALLEYQEYSFADHCAALRLHCAPLRRLLWPFRGIVRRWLMAQSPYKANQKEPSGPDTVD